MSVNTSQSVSNFTKLNNAFKAYNGNLTKSTQLQTAYIKAVGNQNSSLGNYLAGLNGAKASMGGYIKSLVGAKVATVGLQVASTLLNAAISMGLSLAISALVSAISSWINKEKEAREEAIENAKAAKEESNNLTELLNKYNQLSREVQSNQGVKEDLLEVQSDLLEALGIEASQIDSLIEKYGDLDNAINQVTLDSLRDAQGDLMTAVDAYEDDLIDVGKSYAHFYSITDRNIIDAAGEDAVKAFKVLETAGIVSSSSVGTAGGALVLTGDDDTVDGILENYQKLKDAQEALNTAVDNGEVTMEEMTANPLYQAINKRLDELEESIGNYNTAVDDLNKNIAQQQILKSLSEQSSIPETQEEFETFKQSMIDTAIASTKFVGSQDDIRDSIINVLSTMPEFEKFFEEIKVKSDTFNNETTILFSLTEENSGSIDDFQSKAKELYSALEKINDNSFEDDDFIDLQQSFTELTGVARDDLAPAIAELIQNELQKLLETLGENAPSDLVDSLSNIAEEVKNASSGVYDLDEALSVAIGTGDQLKSLKDEVAEFGAISNSTINSLMQKYPQLTELLTNYLQGYVDEAAVIEALQNVYAVDENNYKSAVVNKMQDNEEFFKNVFDNHKDFFNQLSEAYDLDVNNWKTLSQAKADIDTNLIQNLSKAWSNYFKIVKVGNEYILSAAKTSNATADFGMHTSKKKAVEMSSGQTVVSKEVFNEAAGIVADLNEVINGLDQIAMESVSLDFEKNSFSNSDSNSSKKTVESIDFIEIKLDRLESKYDKLKSKAENTFLSTTARANAYSGALKKNAELIATQEQAYNAYMAKVNSVGLSEEYASQVRNGSLNIETVTDENLKNQIQEYQEWYNLCHVA